MLHVVTGWEAAERKGEPTVLYCGTDRQKAQQVATEADPKFVRVEYAEVLMSFKWTRRIAPKNSPHQPLAATPAPAGAAAYPSAEVFAGLPSPASEEVGEAGPELSPAPVVESGKSPKNNRR